MPHKWKRKQWCVYVCVIIYFNTVYFLLYCCITVLLIFSKADYILAYFQGQNMHKTNYSKGADSFTKYPDLFRGNDVTGRPRFNEQKRCIAITNDID